MCSMGPPGAALFYYLIDTGLTIGIILSTLPEPTDFPPCCSTIHSDPLCNITSPPITLTNKLGPIRLIFTSEN